MIYFCADDYGLNSISSKRIETCIQDGAINKVSIYPNLEQVDLQNLLNIKNLRISLHLNLVEGKCMANAKEIGLIADEKGSFKHSFGGLLKLAVFHKKELEEQVYKEIKAQVLYYKSILPSDVPFCIDSHQHTYMIPTIFKALNRVLKDENIKVEYMRIPTEPLMPYISTPSLYFTYSPKNIIKQWLLKVLWLKNKKIWKKSGFPAAYFLGILFSGKMDHKRVNKILPKYIKLAKKTGGDIEVLFHPGYLDKSESNFEEKNIAFTKFYFSENRKIEFDSVKKISERSVR